MIAYVEKSEQINKKLKLISDYLMVEGYNANI